MDSLGNITMEGDLFNVVFLYSSQVRLLQKVQIYKVKVFRHGSHQIILLGGKPFIWVSTVWSFTKAHFLCLDLNVNWPLFTSDHRIVNHLVFFPQLMMSCDASMLRFGVNELWHLSHNHQSLIWIDSTIKSRLVFLVELQSCLKSSLY